MKKLLLLLILILQTACAGNVEVRLLKDHEGINKEFTPHIQEFIYASKGKVSKRDFEGFSMGFRDFNKNSSTIGMCHYLAYEVDISRKWWENNTSQSKRIELVFHELGHCILQRGHTQQPIGNGFVKFLERLGFEMGIFEEKESLPDNCSASIMHPYELSEECINRHFNYYVEELFKRKRVDYIERLIEPSVREPSHQVVCTKKPKVINKTNTWTRRDEDTYRRAKKKCVESYHSCLKTFWKKTKDSYAALCE